MLGIWHRTIESCCRQTRIHLDADDKNVQYSLGHNDTRSEVLAPNYSAGDTGTLTCIFVHPPDYFTLGRTDSGFVSSKMPTAGT